MTAEDLQPMFYQNAPNHRISIQSLNPLIIFLIMFLYLILRLVMIHFEENLPQMTKNQASFRFDSEKFYLIDLFLGKIVYVKGR